LPPRFLRCPRADRPGIAEVMRMGDPIPPMFFFRDQDGNSLLIVG
jgi:hypothetical protein